MRRLQYKAPRRCSLEDGMGKYTTHEWDLRSVLLYIFLAGGHFVKGGHEFDSEQTAKIAVDPKTYQEVEYD